jgi:hypothetical protein
VRCLTGWLLDELLALRHRNGNAMVRIYGPVTTHARGGTVTMNFYAGPFHFCQFAQISSQIAAPLLIVTTRNSDSLFAAFSFQHCAERMEGTRLFAARFLK